MNAFEAIVATLLRREGYWIISSFKVDLTKEEKRTIGRHSSPRWEIDLVAYKGATNEIIAIECKSFLDSQGVIFKGGEFIPPSTYKLFTEPTLRNIVLTRLGKQLIESQLCPPKPTIRLALAIGKIAKATDRNEMRDHFKKQNWVLYDDISIQSKLRDLQDTGYENDIAFVAAKLALHDKASMACRK
jgi:hypothetical protein